MGEIDDIDTAIDTLVAYDRNDLKKNGLWVTAIGTISDLMDAWTTTDIDGYADKAAAIAACKKAKIIIALLIDKIEADDDIRFGS